jgi:hypothetical protein
MVLDQQEFNMKVALVCIAKNEDNYIQEWIDYNLKLGFDHIFIYRNNWKFESSNKNVTVIDFPGNVKQLPAYNDFINNNVGIYDWGAFFDVDEFLVLKKHNNIKEFISEYTEHDSIAVNWVLFGNNGLSNVIDNNYSLITRFTKRQHNVDPHIKVIVKIKNNVKFVLPHNTNTSWISPEKIVGNGPFNYKGSDEIVQLNHYFCKTKEEYIEKINRGRSDTNFSRKINEYDPYNLNEIIDTTALTFFKK